MREQPKIPEERLRACLQDQYDLIPVTLKFFPRGKDHHAGVYRVVSEPGTPYLLKINPGSLYEPGCLDLLGRSFATFGFYIVKAFGLF